MRLIWLGVGFGFWSWVVRNMSLSDSDNRVLRVVRHTCGWGRVVFDVVVRSDGLLAFLLVDESQPDIVFKSLDGEELRGVGASARAAPTPRSTLYLF